MKTNVKETKNFYFLLPAFFYAPFEHILVQMSTMGWSLSSYSWFKFTFEKTPPKIRKYFIYHSGGVRSSDGKFSLSLRYGDILSSFGAKRKYSKLNAYTRAHVNYISIIELEDGIEKEERFIELKDDRNKLHCAEAIRDCLLLELLGLLVIKIRVHRLISYMGWFICSYACLYVLLTLISFFFTKMFSIHRNH